LCQFVHSFSKYSVHELVTDQVRTDRRMDEVAGREHYACPASVDWRRLRMFAVVIAFMCFYHAERILSAIAKFLVHLFWEREGRAEWERGEL